MARIGIVALVSALASLSLAQSSELKILAPGDKAPDVKVLKWVKGTPVEKFKAGQVYVVEFWSTSCVPCKASIPHLTKLQKDFGSKVQFIGVSIAEIDQAKVDPFVKDMGEKMDYTIAADQQENSTARRGFMSTNWMDATAASGIPTAFVVKDGKLAWIGHPMEIDGPLQKIVEGKFDVENERAKYLKAKAEEIAFINDRREFIQLRRAFGEAFLKSMDSGNWDETDKVLEKLAATKAGKEAAGFQRLIVMIAKGQNEKAATYGDEVISKEDAVTLNTYAWDIVDPKSKIPDTIKPEALKFALKAATKAVELSARKEAALIDTLAWAHFHLGNKGKAIELEEEAIKIAAPADKAEYENTLKTFRGE